MRPAIHIAVLKESCSRTHRFAVDPVSHQFRFGKKKKSFNVQLWHFAPIGLLVSVLGTIIGALGPVLNPFYLNYALEKEELIATKLPTLS